MRRAPAQPVAGHRGTSRYWGLGDQSTVDEIDAAGDKLDRPAGPGPGPRLRVDHAAAPLATTRRRCASAAPVLDSPASRAAARGPGPLHIAHLQAMRGTARCSRQGDGRGATPTRPSGGPRCRTSSSASSSPAAPADPRRRPGGSRRDRRRRVRRPGRRRQLPARLRLPAHRPRAGGPAARARRRRAGPRLRRPAPRSPPAGSSSRLAHAERAHVAALAATPAAAAAAIAEADRHPLPAMAVLYPWLEQARAWVAGRSGGDLTGGAEAASRLAAGSARDGFAGARDVRPARPGPARPPPPRSADLLDGDLAHGGAAAAERSARRRGAAPLLARHRQRAAAATPAAVAGGGRRFRELDLTSRRRPPPARPLRWLRRHPLAADAAAARAPRRAARPLRPDPHAGAGRAAPDADRPGAADRAARRRRGAQPGHRRPALPVPPHGREPPPAGLRQARRHRPRRAGRGAALAPGPRRRPDAGERLGWAGEPPSPRAADRPLRADHGQRRPARTAPPTAAASSRCSPGGCRPAAATASSPAPAG